MQRESYLKKFVEIAEQERVSLKRACPFYPPIRVEPRTLKSCMVEGLHFHWLTWDWYDKSKYDSSRQWLYAFWLVYSSDTKAEARVELETLYKSIALSGCALPTLKEFDNLGVAWRYDFWLRVCVSMSDAWGLPISKGKDKFLVTLDDKQCGVHGANVVVNGRYMAVSKAVWKYRSRFNKSALIEDQYKLSLIHACKGTSLRHAAKLLVMLDLTRKETKFLRERLRHEFDYTKSISDR